MTSRILAAVLATLATLPFATALGESYAGNYEHCVNLMRIRSTEVIDDRHIVFRMHGDRNYVNRLPHPCPGLGSEDAFMYRPSMSQLCDLDSVTVLHNRGFGFTPGPSCGLGMFEPMSDEAIAQLKLDAKRK